MVAVQRAVPEPCRAGRGEQCGSVRRRRGESRRPRERRLVASRFSMLTVSGAAPHA